MIQTSIWQRSSTKLLNCFWKSPYSRMFIIVLLALALFGCSKNKQATTNRGTASNGSSSLSPFQQGTDFGYKNATGEIIIKPQYAEAGNFSWGLAAVRPSANGGWGYIDVSGNEIIHPQFEAAGDFVDGIAVVLKGGQFMYIGPDGSSLGAFDEDHPRKPLSVGDTLYVIHPNGLIARAAGDLNAAPAFQVKFDEAVVYITDPQTRRSESFDGLRGNWLSVRYRGKTGYLFDLYLSRYPSNVELQPVEHYRLISSLLNNDQYSTYTLTKFSSGGRTIVHDGPNWTENDEILPDVTVDQTIARLKLHPNGDLGSLVTSFTGTTNAYTTESGDSIALSARRDLAGFLEKVTLSRKNEESSFEATISKYTDEAVEIVTTLSTAPSSDNAPSVPNF